MHIIYIDDSKDHPLMTNGQAVFSALAVPAEKWNESFNSIKEFRRKLKSDYGLYVNKEFHASEFISGRGKIADGIIPKGLRCDLFRKTLEFIGSVPGFRLFTAIQPRNQEYRALERLLNRINRTLLSWDSRAILVCDAGHEIEFTRMIRRMRVHNPIPSQFGNWPEGSPQRNIPLERILEDPLFKHSHNSYHIQLVDFCAYAALRKESRIESKNKYNLHLAYEILQPIWVHETSRHPDRIIR